MSYGFGSPTKDWNLSKSSPSHDDGKLRLENNQLRIQVKQFQLDLQAEQGKIQLNFIAHFVNNKDKFEMFCSIKEYICKSYNTFHSRRYMYHMSGEGTKNIQRKKYPGIVHIVLDDSHI